MKRKMESEPTSEGQSHKQSKCQSVFSASVFDEKAVAELKSRFAQETPFPHGKLDGVLDEEFVKELRDELINREVYNDKGNDLYCFKQSDALEGSPLPKTCALRQALYSPKFRSLLQTVTGIELNEKPDLFAAVYQDTHRLLAHDDRIGSRRVAFIVYLVPEDWNEADGGALDLFSVDKHNEPYDVVKSLVPCWNSMVFFEVSEKSFHQVAEVLSCKDRLSVGGWWHGEPIPKPKPAPEPARLFAAPAALDEARALVAKWMSPQYLFHDVAEQVKEAFADDSSVVLPNFLHEERYAELLESVKEYPLWRVTGPRHKRHYLQLQEQADTPVPAPLKEFLALFRSDAMATLLSALTGVTLEDVSSECRKFGHTHYTLLHDQNTDMDSTGVDVCFTALLGSDPHADAENEVDGEEEEEDEEEEDMGGTIAYLHKEDDEVLLQVAPQHNTLSIVFRADPGTMSFVKYMTHKAGFDKVEFNSVYQFHMSDSDSEEGEEEAER